MRQASGLYIEGQEKVWITTKLAKLGQTLTNMRCDMGWSIANLSDETGINPATISRIERSVIRPRLPHILSLAQMYGQKMENMLDGSAYCNGNIHVRPLRFRKQWKVGLDRYGTKAMNELPTNLMKLRRKGRHTQTFIAKILGTSKESVCYIEKGQRIMCLNYLLTLAEFYGLSITKINKGLW